MSYKSELVQMNPSVCEGSYELLQNSPGFCLGCRQPDAANITLHGWILTVILTVDFDRFCHHTAAAWCLLSVPPLLQGVTGHFTHPGCTEPARRDKGNP